MDAGLPKGWAETRLKEIIELNPKNIVNDDAEVSFIPMTYVPINFRERPKYDIKKWGEIKKGYTHFQDGDVVVAKITPCFENGKSTIIQGLKNGLGSGSTEYYVLRPFSASIDPRLLLALVKTTAFIRNGTAVMTGTVGHKRVPKDYLLDYTVPLPPLREQKRIATKLDSLLAKVDACKARLDKISEQIKRFRQSVLAAATSGRLTEDWREESFHEDGGNFSIPKYWERIKVEQISKIISGAAFKKNQYSDSGYRLLQIANVTYGKTKWEKESFIPYDLANKFSNLTLQQGDIVLALNRPITNGLLKVAQLGSGDIPATLYQRVGKFELNNKENANYLFLSLQTEDIRKQIEKKLKGSDQPYLNTSLVPDLKVNFPPLEEQKEIVSRVEALFSIADQMDKKLEAAKTMVDKLTASILDKAFRGELVPQDPNDPPATELLERIRAEREALGATKNKGRRTKRKTTACKKRSKAETTKPDDDPEHSEFKQKTCDIIRTTKSKSQSAKQGQKRFDKSEVLNAFRKAIFRQNDIEELHLLRLVGQRLGVHRLSQPIRQELESHIKTATRRKIISRNGNGYTAGTPTFNHYENDYLIRALRSVTRDGYSYQRDFLVEELAHYLGFDKPSEAMQERMKSIFNKAIRRGVLYRKGELLASALSQKFCY